MSIIKTNTTGENVSKSWSVSIGVLAIGILVSGCQLAPHKEEKGTKEWQAMARGDLDAIRELIVSAHPGSIDELNPRFRDWSESGYQEALKLIPRVISYDAAMSAVRYYVTGFLDGHFRYSDNMRGDVPSFINGWKVNFLNGDYVVTAKADTWPTALPPTGSKLVQCDGRSPDTIIKEDIAPFVDRRDVPGIREDLASWMMGLRLSGSELKRCRFRTDDGATIDLDIKYQAVTPDQYFSLYTNQLQPRIHRGNSFELKDGVLWIHAATFQPSPPEIARLETMLKELPKLVGVKEIVFDVRGNRGGDSRIGDRIFEAAVGGLDYDRRDIERQPRTYAQWRVSDISIATVARAADRMTSLYGDQSEQAKATVKFLNELKSAKATGQPWVEQAGGYLVTRADVLRRNGKLRRFDGKVALLTDSNCASACLDFADLVRQVPGSLHVGQTTSSDTVYIDMGYAELPSGNLLFMPLKVWRNRIRGNNEKLVPDAILKVDFGDDSAVYEATLAALRSAP